MNDLQNRLQRAAMACRDESGDRATSNPELNQQMLDACIIGALDKHIQLVPSVQKRLEGKLAALMK